MTAMPLTGTGTNPLRALGAQGQSVWLDYIRRHLITSGELSRLIEADGLGGVTSNPAIFEKAIAGSTDYADLLATPEARALDPKALYERLAIRDIRDAADLLRPVYERTRARDGYVSLEASPFLARDTAGTLGEARRLWQAVGRPNCMIKVPATAEGIPAIRTLIAEGINVNVTLLFSQAAWEEVAFAYLEGLEARARQGGALAAVSSVASFFISRIDAAIDAQIAARLKAGQGDPATWKALGGQVAIANARLVYERYRELLAGPRWQALADQGAQPQRLLWASTSTKNPQYRDVVYVEELIGPDTVDTIPPATLDAFRDHGQVRQSLTEHVQAARETMAALERAGIAMTAVTDRLLEEGLALFAEAFDKLLRAVSGRCGNQPARTGRQTHALPAALERAVTAAMEDWRASGRVWRLWARDASVWTGQDEGQWLGWLGITDDQLAHIQHLVALGQEVRTAGYAHILLLGMGGSSLGPEVLSLTFGRQAGFPELLVLDSTDPAQVRAFERRIDVRNTLFIVSSKSGGTLEPNIFKRYFFERAAAALGPEEAGRRFIAITDPGSKMQEVAESDKFGHIFFGLPSIGGRYSVLSHFGTVPAAAMGLDVGRLLDGAEHMVHACSPCVPIEDNPGVMLGIVLGVAARHGRDKVTIIASPGIHDLGAWLEQLLAESTGKLGRGLIPVDREALGAPGAYGKDRIFAYVRLDPAADPAQDAAVLALEQAGQPVIRITLADAYDLGQEFFRWEIATAVAGAVLGIHPFDQPDVEASKIATRALTSAYDDTGALPAEAPILEAGEIHLYADPHNAAALAAAAGGDRSLAGYLRAHLGRLHAGDYFALLGYVQMDDAHERTLQAVRHAVRDATGVATCLGFGPRFLHSTGQAYKGGPNSGVFLQVTCDDAADVAVPGQRYTFGVVKAAQARGDFQVLAERGRRALRVHLGPNVAQGLAQLETAVRQALA